MNPTTLLPPLVLALAVTPLMGCGESVEEFISVRRPWSNEQLRNVDRVRELARELPENEWPTMKDPGPLSICDLVIPAYREAGCDTWVIDQEQLDHPERFLDPPPPVSFGHADWLVTTRSLLASGRFPPNDAYPEGDEAERLTRPIIYAFSWLERLRFLLVIRTYDLERPVLAPDQKSYTPGSFRGEALLFSLRPEVTSLGSVPFSYSMVGDVKVRMRRSGIHPTQLDKAFADGVREALAEALVSRLDELERPTR
jgi:hypothetical protein